MSGTSLPATCNTGAGRTDTFILTTTTPPTIYTSSALNTWLAAVGTGKVTLTQPATGSTLTILDGKTFTVNKTLTLDGTDGTTMTFPTTSATIARTDAANSFTGSQTISGGGAAITFNQNAGSDVAITNTTAGTSAFAGFTATNGSAVGQVLALSASYTAVAAWTNKLLLASTGSSGIVINAREAAGTIGFFTGATGGTAKWTIQSTGHIIAGTDNSYDIGAAGATRPRTVYVGTSVVVPSITLSDGNVVLGTAAGTQLGTATGQKLSFWGVTPVVQQVFATGTGKTVDNLITLLQTLGLCKQS